MQRSRAVRPSVKADYAMDGRTKRPFFGLTTKDEDLIEREAGRALDVNLRRTEGK